MEVRISLDSGYQFGQDVFGEWPPIPDVGTSVAAPGAETVTLEGLVEQRRGGDWAATFSLLADVTTMSLFADWIIGKINAHKVRNVRINGRDVQDEDQIRAFLQSLAEGETKE